MLCWARVSYALYTPRSRLWRPRVRATRRLLRASQAVFLDLPICSRPSSRSRTLSPAPASREIIPSSLAFSVFMPRTTIPLQPSVLTQRRGRRLVASSPELVPSSCCLVAVCVARAQARLVCSGGNFFRNEGTQVGSCYSSNSSTGTTVWKEGWRRSVSNGRAFSTGNHQTDTETNSCEGRSWPSIFDPLLAGLKRAPLRSTRLRQQQREQEAVFAPCLKRSTHAEASFEAVSAVTASSRCPVTGTPADEKPRGIFYVIHTFGLHPYEAIVFEEALYRFLGQRIANNREHSSAAASPQNFTARTSVASSASVQTANLNDGETSRLNVYISRLHGSAEVRSVVQPQQHRLPQTVSQQEQASVQPNSNRTPAGRDHPTQQEERQRRGQQHQQIPTQQTTRIPSVACAFLHHPPYRPACGDATIQSDRCSSSKQPPDARRASRDSGMTDCQLEYPSQAVVFGLSEQPAACVRAPKTVLQQQRALFIRRFTGGGTVVIGSGSECFCVGLLLPHTFSGCRPYPRELFDVCTSLYLGANIWEKQGCATATQEAPDAATCLGRGVAVARDSTTPATNSSSSGGTGTAAAESPAATETREQWEALNAQEIASEAAKPRHREAASKAAAWSPGRFPLAALSPFAAARWGLLENDYVVTYSTSSLICSNPSATPVPAACAASLVEVPRNSTGSCSHSMTCNSTIERGQTASTHDPLPVHLRSASHMVFKVGGNAQALSRYYGLQHTSFVWDEEQLQGELKGLLLVPKKQPKYRNNRPHIAFLRSVREGLKSHVRIAPHRAMQQHLGDEDGVQSISSAEPTENYASGAQPTQPDCRGGTVTVWPVDTPSSVLLSLGLLLEGHALRRNCALRVHSSHRDTVVGREAAESATCSDENFGQKWHERSAETLRRSSGGSRAAANASTEERNEGSEERSEHDEEEWDCVHCVVSSDNRIPTEFKRMWAEVDRLAHCRNVASPESEARREQCVKISAAVCSAEDSSGIRRADDFFEGAYENGRPLHVLPIEAVSELVYELFEGSLKSMRSTRLVDADGKEILENAYRNLFEVNRIVPI